MEKEGEEEKEEGKDKRENPMIVMFVVKWLHNFYINKKKIKKKGTNSAFSLFKKVGSPF